MLVLYNIIGILFRKDAGQHILKNPLVINGIIEKVPNKTQLVVTYNYGVYKFNTKGTHNYYIPTENFTSLTCSVLINILERITHPLLGDHIVLKGQCAIKAV